MANTLGKSKNVGYFVDFEQVKNETDNKTPLRETGCLSIFWVTTLYHRHSTLPSQTREGLHQLWALPQHKAFFFNV